MAPSKKRASTKRAREESEETTSNAVAEETTTTTTTTTTTVVTSSSTGRASKRAASSSSASSSIAANVAAVATEAIEEPLFADDIANLKAITATIGCANATRAAERTELILNPTEIRIEAGKITAWQGTFKGVRIALDGQEGDVYCTATVSVMLPPRK